MTETAPAEAPAPRVRKAWDIWLTIGLILVAIITFVIGAVVSYLGIAFFGSCNSNGCSGQSVVDGFFVVAALGVVGILASIVFLIIKRRGWPIALITIGVIFFGWVAANVIDIPPMTTVLPPGSGPSGKPENVPQTRFGDAAGSILLLVLSFAGYLIGVILSFFGFLVTGVCAARSCNAEAGTTAQAIVAVMLAVVLLLGAGITIALIVSKRRAIVVALVTLILIVVGWIVGVVAFFLALSS